MSLPKDLERLDRINVSYIVYHFNYFTEGLKNFLTTFALSILYWILMFLSSTKNHFINFLTILII